MPKPHVIPTPLRTVWLLLAGVVLSSASAWMCAAYSARGIVHTGFPSNVEPLTRSHPALHELAADMTLTEFGRQQWRGIGIRMEVIYATNGVSNMSLTAARSGWPMPAMHGRSITGNGASTLQFAVHRPAFVPFAQESYPPLAFLPIKPLWPGLLANAMVYAMVLWLGMLALNAQRRRRRLHKGLCPACGYPRSTSPVCSECGERAVFTTN